MCRQQLQACRGSRLVAFCPSLHACLSTNLAAAIKTPRAQAPRQQSLGVPPGCLSPRPRSLQVGVEGAVGSKAGMPCATCPHPTCPHSMASVGVFKW